MTTFLLCFFISSEDHMALPSIILSISHTNNDNNNSTSDLDFPSGLEEKYLIAILSATIMR